MRWKRILRTAALSAIATGLSLYAGDHIVFKIRIVTNRGPYGTVTVQRFDAVLKKNGKTQFIFDPPQPQTCANALFAHNGFAPCWYLARHREQGTNI
jgi:hypothetical protein